MLVLASHAPNPSAEPDVAPRSAWSCKLERDLRAAFEVDAPSEYDARTAILSTAGHREDQREAEEVPLLALASR